MTRPLLVLAALLAVAADPAPGGLGYTAPTPPPPPDLAGLVTRLVGLTAGVLTVCGLVLWAARRTNRPAAATGDAGRLRHEGTLVLDRRCSVHLIRADGQDVAVTTDATGLRGIVVLSEPFEASLAADASPGERGA